MSIPISKPRLERAVDTSEAPVPPSSIEISFTPVILPPVIATFAESCKERFPKSLFKTYSDNVSTLT